MARSSYSLYIRHSSVKGNGIYYVRFWDPVSHSYTSSLSTQVLRDRYLACETGLNPNRKSGARKIVEGCLLRGFVPVVTKPSSTDLEVFLRKFWNWEQSDYVRGKLARRSNGIGKAYVKNCHSWCDRYVIPTLGKVRLADLKPGQIESWLLQLRAEVTLSNRTINRILQSLRVPLREATRLGLIPTDPSVSIQSLEESSSEKGILTSNEIRDLLAMKWNNRKAFVAFCLALSGGLRMGEIRGLKKNMIGKESITVAHSYSKVVGLKSTKTNKVRSVVVPKRVMELIWSLIEHSPVSSPWVFSSDADPSKPIYDKIIERSFYEALAKIGISDDSQQSGSRLERNLSFHSLRHWFNATLAGALPAPKLRLLTGHSSEAMTQQYNHITEEDMLLFQQAQDEKILCLFPLHFSPE